MSYINGLIYVDLAEHGVSETDLQDIFGYEEQSTRELFSGKIIFEKEELIKIAEFKKIPISSLVGDKTIV